MNQKNIEHLSTSYQVEHKFSVTKSTTTSCRSQCRKNKLNEHSVFKLKFVKEFKKELRRAKW